MSSNTAGRHLAAEPVLHCGVVRDLNRADRNSRTTTTNEANAASYLVDVQISSFYFTVSF